MRPKRTMRSFAFFYLAQAGSNDKKNVGQKSRWTVPIKSIANYKFRFSRFSIRWVFFDVNGRNTQIKKSFIFQAPAIFLNENFNPLCTSRLNLYDDIEEFTVKLFSVQFSSGFFCRKALDLCFYMQKTEVFYRLEDSLKVWAKSVRKSCSCH